MVLSISHRNGRGEDPIHERMVMQEDEGRWQSNYGSDEWSSFMTYMDLGKEGELSVSKTLFEVLLRWSCLSKQHHGVGSASFCRYRRWRQEPTIRHLHFSVLGPPSVSPSCTDGTEGCMGATVPCARTRNCCLMKFCGSLRAWRC